MRKLKAKNSAYDLKFKAYDLVLNQLSIVRGMMLLGNYKHIVLAKDKHHGNINEYLRKFNEVELMQYSTLNDVYGVEVYEGDVIKFPKDYIYKNGKEFCAVVEKVNGNFYVHDRLLSEVNDIVIKIGNIYAENASMVPKLHKKEQKKWRF